MGVELQVILQSHPRPEGASSGPLGIIHLMVPLSRELEFFLPMDRTAHPCPEALPTGRQVGQIQTQRTEES